VIYFHIISSLKKENMSFTKTSIFEKNVNVVCGQTCSPVDRPHFHQKQKKPILLIKVSIKYRIYDTYFIKKSF